MRRQHLEKNVYEALQERLHFIFQEFDNIFVSFSGGKDSGLLLNLVLDFRRKYYPDRRIGVFHQDFEAQYSATTEFVERTFEGSLPAFLVAFGKRKKYTDEEVEKMKQILDSMGG